MIPDLPIWSAATLLIRQHGGDAETIAAQHADQMLNRGDLYGRQIWMRIKRAIAELQGPA